MEPLEVMVSGLDGVVVADTVLSHVDGARGELWIRGRRLDALVRVEDVLELLWDGLVVGPGADALGAARVAMAERVRWPEVLPARDGAVAIRIGLAPLDEATPIELVAATGVILAGWCRGRAGQPVVAPDPTRDHGDDLVRMIRGVPDPGRGQALAAYLCAVAEHGMNAGAFAARVVASTGSDDTSAVLAGLGALKGPLHGGAPGPVLDMLDAIGDPARAAGWIRGELDAGRRIMGMGHRIYRVRDPRVAVLEGAIRRLVAAGIAADRLALAGAVERVAERLLAERHPERPLRANVEFATAVLLEAVGVDRGAFTAAFAAGRVIGWLAHVGEQRRTGRLIRPESRYVGPVPAA